MPSVNKIKPANTTPGMRRELKNLPGEKWKDIPNYENTYQVSNYGRVKSLERTMILYYSAQNTYRERRIKERILAQRIIRHYNHFVKDYRYECLVNLFDDYGGKTQLVHRLVFSAFKKQLSYDDDNLCISHKDGNGLNNRLSNLERGYKSDVLKRAYSNNRHITPFALKSKQELKRIHQKGGQSRKKKVIQFTLNGKIIERYDSIAEASNMTGIADSNIIQVLKKRTKQAGGYKWEYAG